MPKVIVCTRDQDGDGWVREEAEFGRAPAVGEYIGNPETLAWHRVALVAHVPVSPHAPDFVAEVFVGSAENPSVLLNLTARAPDQ